MDKWKVELRLWDDKKQTHVDKVVQSGMWVPSFDNFSEEYIIHSVRAYPSMKTLVVVADKKPGVK